jgi:predicted nucleic acid-binding protein
LQKHYVRWRRGESYKFTHLLSPAKAARLVRRLTEFHVTVVVPPVPEQEIVRFSKRRRVLAHLYNRLSALGMNRLLLPVCPFFRIVGIRGTNKDLQLA